MRIGVIGSGISGLGAAWLLSQAHSVDVFESEDKLGGHACTIDLPLGDRVLPVDIGFMVFNERTYPGLIRLFEHLGVESEDSDMSFSVRVGSDGIEWSGASLATILARPKNLARARFWRMLFDVVRLDRSSARLLSDPSIEDLTVGELFERERYGRGFVDWYLTPLGAAIWSTPAREMLSFPAGTFLRFADNHGLLKVRGKPQWRTPANRSKDYVARIVKGISGETHTVKSAARVRRASDGVEVDFADGDRRTYDHVVLACHADQSLALLEDPTDEETNLLALFPYQPNHVTVHSDPSPMPARRALWSAWNYHADPDRLSVTYYLNVLQNLPCAMPVLVTLNAVRQPDPDAVHERRVMAHPIFTRAAVKAQADIGRIQGADRIWYCGAWQRYGFHEDGFRSAVELARRFGISCPWEAR